VCVLALAGALSAQNTITTQPTKTGDSPSTTSTITEVGGRTLSQWMADLKHPDASTRSQAITNIIGFGEAGADAVPLLIDRCKDRDASPRVKAVLALKLMTIRERDVPKVVDALAQRLAEDPQTIVRYEAAMALVRFADDAKPALKSLLKGLEDTGTWEIRHACIIAIRKAGFDPKSGPDPQATRALLVALHDPVERVRLEATVGLGAMGKPADPQMLAAVTRALQQQSNYKDKALSLWSHVSLMALDDKVTDKSLEAISKLLKSPEREIRLQVLLALAAMGNKARNCVPDALEALEDKETSVVAAACTALGYLGDQGPRVMNALVKMTERKEQPIVYAACEALGHMGRAQPEVVAALTAVTQRKELDDQILREATHILEKLKKSPK
jgi:HEAT repeat protein